MTYLLDIAAYLPFGLVASVIFLVVYETALRVRNEQVFWFHRIIILILGLYLTAVFAVTVSPVYGFSLSPNIRNVNLIPFQVVKTISENPLNFWGNLFLFMPIGVLLVLLSNRCKKLYVTLLTGMGLSILIEVLQLFGTRGTDIDDVILNTAGTLLGYFIGRLILLMAPVLCKRIGVLVEIDHKYYKKRRDAGSATILAVFVLISVFSAGFSMSTRTQRESVSSVLPDSKSDARQTAASMPVELKMDASKSEDSAPNLSNAELPSSANAVPALKNIGAKNVYLWDVNSNAVLYEKASNQQIAPASTAKMLTALTALDYCDENEEVAVGEEIKRIAKDASRAWLNVGNRLTVRQLLDALLLPSGNDAAYTLAVFAGRKICQDRSAPIDKALASFVTAMNNKAVKVGATHSKFVCPDGYDKKGQYTTAQDLACIAKAVMKTKLLQDIVKSEQISDIWPNGKEVTYHNTNALVNPDSRYFYPGAAGLKTGSSDLAGGCLVSSAYINKDLYICVVMGSSEEGRWKDSLALYRTIQK